MVAITSTSHKGVSPSGAPVRRRISAKVSKALDLIATTGISQIKAAEQVGMDRSALNRALQKENVKAELEVRKVRYISVQTAMRNTLKARALEVAAELMENAASEAVRMRAVEFLAGESKQGPSVSVTVNAGGGYEFVRPGQRLVEIEGSPPDQATAGNDAEDAEIIDD